MDPRLLAKRLLDAGVDQGRPDYSVGQGRLRKRRSLRLRLRGQPVIHALDKPLKATGGLVILKGNLAPDGCVIKVAGHERLFLTKGPARVFDSEDLCFAAIQAGKINPSDVLVIRYEGPRGGPGMREMLAVTAAIKGIPELSETVALLTDGRFSGATRGLMGWACGTGRRNLAGRSRRCMKEIRLPSIYRIASYASKFRRTKFRRGSLPGKHLRRDIAVACLRNMRTA